MTGFLQDFRYALRQLRKSPGFTAVAVLTLALGIGATTAMFSLVDRILFRSLPYPHDNELVSVGVVAPIIDGEFLFASNYLGWREHQTPFVGFTSSTGVNDCDLTDEHPVRVACASVASTFLPTLGIQPILGRNFTPEEDRPDSPKVALLDYGLWRDRFGGDRSVVGRVISLDGQPTQILGVLPRDFEFPTLARTNILVPEALEESIIQRNVMGPVVRVFGRLKPPGYFETIGIPLRRGRLLDGRDGKNAPAAMVVSESLARRRFPHQDPIGQRLHVGGGSNATIFTIVGVVGDVKQASLDINETDAVYTTTTQWNWADGTLSLVVRSNGEVTALTPAIKNAIWSVDRDQPIVRIATMDSLIAASAEQRSFVLNLFEAFGLLSLILAATGIYGVLSGSVAERTREIGVRSALGASRGNILGLVFRQGMSLTGLGMVLGLFGAWAAGQAIAAMLFDVKPLDPPAYVGASVLLAIVTAIACSIPAWRAASVDPMVALRSE